MSITDELRKWCENRAFLGNGWQELHDIADRIDAKYDKAMSRAGQLLADAEKDRDYNYANWQECKQKVLQGNITINELNTRIKCLEDALLHCIERPKDANGEDIHIGDMMKWCNGSFTVHELKLTEDGWQMWDGEHGYTVHADECIHAPTVEDVLREFAQEMNENMGMYTGEAIDADEWRDADAKTVAKFAKRLMLAEGEGE